ncbi:hypothetical protein BGX28_006032 [Mortierella sp. GBA30]|nr:hypothetical protein BGX28_006032 [Mortierella sp. GBA30]
MSLMNACQRFFEIPELCGLIACYLCPHDLTRLSLGLKHNGHLIKHAELSSCYEGAWARWGLYDDDYQDTDFEATGENNDTLLATTLLKHCGSNLTSLVISDGSFDGRLLSIFLSRIKGDTNWNGAERLDNIQKLEIGVTKLAFETLLQPLISELSQKRSSGTSVIFSDVTDLRLDAQRQPDLDEYGSDWDDELCYSTDGNVDGNPQAPEIDIRDLIRTFPSLRNLALVDTRISISNSVQPQSENEQDEDESTEAKAAAVYHLHSLNLQDCTVSTEQMTWILERTRDLKSLKLGSSLVGNPEVFISSPPSSG